MRLSVLKLFGTGSIMASLALVLVASAIGLWMDAKGFAVNLLAGVVGIFVGFVIGLLILDKYIEAKRKEQWAKVRGLTYTSIANHACDIFQEAGISFGFQPDSLMNLIGEGRDHLAPRSMDAMESFISELSRLPNAQTYSGFSEQTVEFYEEVRWDLDQICEVLYPRVLDSASSEHVVEALAEFAKSRQNLRNAVYVEKRIAIGGIFPTVLQLLEKARVVYNALYEDSKS